MGLMSGTRQNALLVGLDFDLALTRDYIAGVKKNLPNERINLPQDF